jgi:hypothetical protein
VTSPLEQRHDVEVEPDERGVRKSATFPGLRLAVDKMTAGDYGSVLAELAGDRVRPS